jgi:hypothetical protein
MSIIGSNILAGASGQAGGGGAYEIERSVRFNNSDSSYLSRVFPTIATNQKITYSLWVKRSALGTTQCLLDTNRGYQTSIDFLSSNALRIYTGNGGGVGSFDWTTAQVFRDCSSWYHIVVAWDTTQGSAVNRLKVYVNGAEVTNWSSQETITQNMQLGFSGATVLIGNSLASSYLSAYLADVFLIDSQALTPTSFGKFDTNGVWQPIAYTGSYGTNGFRLPFSDNSTAAALGTDTSSNGNDWTVNNLIAGPPTTSNSWSGYFNGSSATPMYVGDNNVFTFDSNFTIESWIKPSNTSGFQVITGKWDAPGQEWLLAVSSGGVAEFHWAPYALGGPAIQSSPGVISSGVWSHVAAVRSSGTITLYVNGISVGTRVEGSAGTNQSTLVTVGYLQYLGGDKLTGYISNLRIVKGTAVYTGSFTVPTSPLTAVANTSLLTLQDSTFVDNSTNGFAITTNGVTISLDSPFEESVDTKRKS